MTHSIIKTTNLLRIENPRSDSCFYNVSFRISQSKILMSGKISSRIFGVDEEAENAGSRSMRAAMSSHKD